MRAALITTVAVAATLLATSAAFTAEEKAGRYSMTPTDGGASSEAW